LFVSLTKEEIAYWRRVVQHLRQQGAEVSPMKPAKQQQPTLPDIELTMDSHGMLRAASPIAAGAVILPPSILDLDKALSHCDSPNVHKFSWVENGAHFVLVAAISDIHPGDTLWNILEQRAVYYAAMIAAQQADLYPKVGDTIKVQKPARYSQGMSLDPWF
jgi:hypothetical protein